MATYVPGTQEKDLTKIIMSLQQIGPGLDTANANIATNTTNIATNTTNIATNTASITAMQAAWTSYTPTVTASSGTFTTVSATGRYLAIGKTVFVKIAITITTVGTASGIVLATLPSTSASAYNFSGNSGAGFQLTVNTVNAQAYFTKYDGTSVISAGATLFASGVYEST